MLCRMCLLESDNTLCIFDQDDSIQIEIGPIIGRHFWFEPTKDDPISIMICVSCWAKIQDFHLYYLTVEEAQRCLTESAAEVKEESVLVEVLKNEYGEEELDKKDVMIGIAADRKHPIESTTGPVFVDVDVEDGDVNAEEPIAHVIYSDGVSYDVYEAEDDVEDDARDDEDYVNDDNDSCSSDEEPLAKKVVRKTVDILQIKTEEKPRRGRKKGSKNKPKTESKTFQRSHIKDEHDIEDNDDYSNDAEALIKDEYPVDNSVKLENDEDNEESIQAMETPKKRRGRKRKSEMSDEQSPPVVKKPGESEYRKKNKEYDDEISQFLRLRCELCLTECQTFADVKRHYRTVHNRRGYVICCTTRKFFKRVFLYEHIQKHKNPDTFKCQFCEKVYCSASVLRSHLLTHDASFEKLYQCDKCPRRFAKLSVLNHHKIIHIPKEEHSFSCDICGKSFPSKNTMQTHRKSVHEKAYSKMCHICAKVINGKTLFAKHQLEHIGIVDPKMQCEKCGMWLKNAFRLKIHTKKHHSEENTGDHICSICGKVSSSSVGLKSHIRYVHAAQRKFLCSVCEKGFKTALNLKEHMTTHTGDILYTCPHCPKTFNSSANMHSHRKKMHRQEWEESRRSRGLPVNTKGKRVIQTLPEDSAENEDLKVAPVLTVIEAQEFLENSDINGRLANLL